MSDNSRERRQRLFFALWPGERVRKAIARITRNLPRRRGRLEPGSNLHITAAFIGAADAKTCACLQVRAAAVEAEPFLLTLARVGYFPRSRILWLGADECPPALTDLVRQLNSCLAVCSVKPDLRSYRPHVTLLRDAASLLGDNKITPVEWRVDSFCLVASETRPEGAHYEILRRFELRLG